MTGRRARAGPTESVIKSVCGERRKALVWSRHGQFSSGGIRSDEVDRVFRGDLDIIGSRRYVVERMVGSSLRVWKRVCPHVHGGRILGNARM